MSNREVVNMEDINVINFMIEAFNKENRDLCERAGMSPDQIEASIAQSQGSIEYMIKNVFFKMKDNGLIAQS